MTDLPAAGPEQRFNIILKLAKEIQLQRDWNISTFSGLITGSGLLIHTYFNQNFPFSTFAVYAQDQIKITKDLMLVCRTEI